MDNPGLENGGGASYEPIPCSNPLLQSPGQGPQSGVTFEAPALPGRTARESVRGGGGVPSVSG